MVQSNVFFVGRVQGSPCGWYVPLGPRGLRSTTSQSTSSSASPLTVPLTWSPLSVSFAPGWGDAKLTVGVLTFRYTTSRLVATRITTREARNGTTLRREVDMASWPASGGTGWSAGAD